MDQADAVTAYLASLPSTGRERVDQIRAAVHAAIPDLGEKISYGILTFTLDGRTAFHAAGYGEHVSLYPVPPDPDLAQRLAPFAAGKGTLKFWHRDELPIELIEDAALALAAAARQK
ncbi:MAG: DUF1801 domain-containing protein [Ornithinimicrobium sp.]|uniref:iron chaperone n=1 Tax=Ornithinimicrobium sp. TaxID=1977084 RepID=UPI0026DFCD2C|nr:DUF1801 domain-containing protein [Ornithinimicrobium sp.]MDO5739894.1 DUF1801 domain-containing protein [Ornithinimicrobium sp.]